MVKAEVKELENYDLLFPCLMIHKNGAIVLFYQSGKGMCVYASKTSPYYHGEHLKSFNMSLFKPFTGEVTLKNA